MKSLAAFADAWIDMTETIISTMIKIAVSFLAMSVFLPIIQFDVVVHQIFLYRLMQHL